ncbi:glycosyltransferase family 4 protein [Nonlabens ponticola]|uniref:Glycosyltransferase n=1 Tax=Nonlabens ponticola TaxID=2496866 RepID=A0A3S9MVF7_9FLAO|nr:glycosyltransferase family 4 protein [Nonlabens ponticola]AZQ43119.1 glycosyltransferase [Nonlabens ponticola]
MSLKKILIIGPFPQPTTGVSLANKVVYDQLSRGAAYRVSSINSSFPDFNEKLGAISAKKLWFYLKLQLSFYKVLGKDILYLTPGQTFFGVVKYSLFILMARITGAQIIQHIHGNFLGRQYHMLTGIKKLLFHHLMSQTDKGIVLSDSLKPNFEPFIESEKIYSLKNFVIDELFLPQQVIAKKEYNKLQIVYLSNLMEEKGIFDVLAALKILKEKGISYQARIAGNISSEKTHEFDQLFADLQYTQYVGVVDVQQKKDLLLWSNVFILPTYYSMEGQPISILEAMATGNLCLVTPHSGIPDIFVEAENGFFVEARNPASITNALEKLSSNPDEMSRIGKHNYSRAKKHYRVSHFTDNLKRIINS